MWRQAMFDLGGALLEPYDGIACYTSKHFGRGEGLRGGMAASIGPRAYDTFRIRFGGSHETAMEMTE